MLSRRAGPPTSATEALDRFRSGAIVLLVVLVPVSVVLLSGVLGATHGPRAAVILPLLGPLAGSVVMLALVVGLARRRAWAVPLTVALLWWLVLAGEVAFVGAALHGSLYLPLAAVGALLVLRLRPRGGRAALETGHDRAVAAVLAGAYLGALDWPYLAAHLLTPGNSPLAFAADALELSVTLDCSAEQTPIDPAHEERLADQSRVGATVRWRWLEREPFPGGADGLVVRWEATGDDVGQTGYVANRLDAPSWVGQRCSSPACALMEPLAEPWWRSRELGVDVDEVGLVDGEVRLGLVRATNIASPHQLTVAAAYAHIDRWVRWAEPASCELAGGPAAVETW